MMKQRHGAFARMTALLSSFLLTSCVYADVQDLQTWNGLTVESPVYKHMTGFIKLEPRISLNNNIGQMVIRSGLNYSIFKDLSIGAGYSWQPVIQPRFNNENRIFEQVIFKQKYSRANLLVRARLEQRMIETVPDVSVRQRILGRIDYHLDRKKIWDAFVSNELFINYNSVLHGPQAGLDQNRLYGGLSRKIGESIHLEAGYMYNPDF